MLIISFHDKTFTKYSKIKNKETKTKQNKKKLFDKITQVQHQSPNKKIYNYSLSFVENITFLKIKSRK